MKIDSKMLVGQYEKTIPIGANDTSRSNHRLNLVMLVTVEEILRCRPSDIAVERNKTDVHFVITVVNKAGRIVPQKDINWGKRCHEVFRLRLFKQVVALGFIFPGTTKATESDTAKLESCQMHIADRRLKSSAGIVVAFDCKDFPALAALSHKQNDVIRHITQGKQNIRPAIWDSFGGKFIVRDDKQNHSTKY